MKKQIIKGVIVGAIIALVIVIYFVNFPKYSCTDTQVPAGYPTNCNRVIDVTPGFILESFVILMAVGGGVGWVYGKVRRDAIVK